MKIMPNAGKRRSKPAADGAKPPKRAAWTAFGPTFYSYLPPYSSDLNPIEPIWAKVKADLCRRAARSPILP